jgi:hypothetical protein
LLTCGPKLGDLVSIKKLLRIIEPSFHLIYV